MMQHTTLEARAAIRKGASYLFSSPDCAGTVLAAIARSAGGSPGNGYLCFGSRRAILRASNAPRLRAKSDRLLGAALATTLQPISRIARDAGCRSAAVAWREETVSVPVVDALPCDKRLRWGTR